MPTKGQLFKFEQKQQPTIENKDLDFIFNSNFDSFSYENNKVIATRKNGDSIETLIAEKKLYGVISEAIKINQPHSKEERKDIITDLIKMGMTQNIIAKATGISQPTVSRILNAQ